jgi:trigger factor
VKSDVETLNPTRVKLTVEVPFDELKPSVDEAYKTIGSQVQVPGFRKGKVPPRIIDQRIGRGAVLQEAVNDALPRFYQQAVEASEIRPLGQPQVEITDVPDPAAGGDLKFTIEVDVRPTIELPDYSSLSVTVDDLEVSDEDVDARVQTLRERFGTLTGVDRPAAMDDFVSMDLAAQIDGEEIDSVKGISYQVGTNQMLEGLDEAIAGMSAQETTTFSSPLAGGDRAGESAEVTVTVQSVKERVLPELDDDFAQLASEFDTLEELRADLRGQAEKDKKLQQGLQARDRVLDALLDAIDVPVPDALVSAEVDQHLEGEGRQEDGEHRAEVEVEARKALKTQFILDAVGEKEKVPVSQQELIEFIVASAQRMGMEPNAFAAAVDEAKQVPAMVSEVARRKALAAVLEQTTVTDASGNVLDMEELVGRPPAGAADGVPAGDEYSDEDDDEPFDELGDEDDEEPLDSATRIPSPQV